MSEVILGSLIGGICSIIGAIISPVITHIIKVFSKKKRFEKYYKTNEQMLYSNRARKNRLNIKRILTIISYLFLFLLGIIIYIILFQLLPKTSENKLLNNKIIALEEDKELLNDKILTYEKQINSLQYADLKIQLSKDAIYTLELLQITEYKNHEHILYLYNTFVNMLYEIENSNDVDCNRITRNMEHAEEQLQYYREMQQ